MVARIVKMYMQVMEKTPIRTQMLSTGILMGSGDLLAQTQLEKKGFAGVEWRRTLVYFLVGTFIVAPACANWYRVMDKFIKGQPTEMALKKMLADQLIFAPSFLPVFITSTGLGQGKSLENIKEHIHETYVPILINNYKVWPAIQLINFYFVPLNYRVLLVQSIALFWNAYLSFTVK